MSYSPSSSKPEIKPIPYTTPLMDLENSCAQCEDLKTKIRQLENTVHNCSQNLDGSRIANFEELKNSDKKDLEIKKLKNQLNESRWIMDSHQRKMFKMRSMENEQNHLLKIQNFNLREELSEKDSTLKHVDAYKMTLTQKIEEKDSRILSLEQKVHSHKEHLDEQLRKNKCLENYMKKQGYHVMEYEDSEKLKRILENKKIRDQKRAQNERTPMKRQMSDEPEIATPTKIAKEQ